MKCNFTSLLEKAFFRIRGRNIVTARRIGIGLAISLSSMLALAALAFAVPLHFEENRGQWSPRVRFEAVTPRYTLELSDTAIAMNFRGGSLRLSLPSATPEGAEELPGKSNYYFGTDRSRWRTGISNFARVRYGNVFRGVDLAVYGHAGEIEYDWIVTPGADPRAIRFSFTGAAGMRIDSGGDLVIDTDAGEIRHTRPRILQADRPIPGNFVLRGSEVQFEIEDYDRSKPLIIDPVLVVNTSFGGHGIDYDFPGLHTRTDDTGTGIAVDSGGNIYVTGTTFSTDFPLVNSLQTPPSQPCYGNCEFSSVFVTKLTPDGATLLYSTYIGAPSAPIGVAGFAPLISGSIAVDAGGTAYVTGSTSGVNFPGVTATAGGTDAFLLRLDSKGAFLGTLLFGGSDDDMGISLVLGPDGFVYLAGATKSADFRATPGGYHAPALSPSNVFVAKVSFKSFFGPTNGAVIYSDVLGPGVYTLFPRTAVAVAADAGGNAYVAAATTSGSWQTTPSAMQTSCAGAACSDLVLAKLDPLGQRLIYSTYLGGSQQENLGGMAVDASGSAYIAGSSNSTDFPVTTGALETADPATAGEYAGFVAKFVPDGSKLEYGTYLDGTIPHAIVVDASRNVYVGGDGGSLPLRYAFQFTQTSRYCASFTVSGTATPSSVYACPSAGSLTELNPSGSDVVWSTYLGSGEVFALALDSASDVYATGTSIAVASPGVPIHSVGVVKIGPGASVLDVPANALVNAASQAPGLPFPGGLASVYVRGVDVSTTMTGAGSPVPPQLAGVSIMVDGVPAPILTIAPLASGMERIDFQVPFEAKSNTVEIRYRGSSVFGFPQRTPPGIFILGDGTPAIEHVSDYSLVTPANPAHPGETIVIYATGLGPVSPAVPSGMAPAGPAALGLCANGFGIDGSSPPYSFGTILYAGLTPGFVGLYQFNVRLRPDLAPGTQHLLINTNNCDGFPLLGNAVPFQSNSVPLPVQ
ncbi:MAG TPA: SBBP repeat-containing protein [Bryobacteraceae bacterium]|jgi:uncharacterized protein (TIGR03437 family)